MNTDLLRNSPVLDVKSWLLRLKQLDIYFQVGSSCACGPLVVDMISARPASAGNDNRFIVMRPQIGMILAKIIYRIGCKLAGIMMSLLLGSAALH
jgi:hypothetical protein